jgi:GNAT superfamily N-acetyltransferase
VRRIGAIAHDIACYRAQVGFAEVLRRLARQAVEAVYAKEEDILQLKTLTGMTPPTRGRALRIERAHQGHLAQVAEFNRRNCCCRQTERVAARMAHGASAFLGLLGDELIGYIWWLDARGVAAEPRFARYDIALEERDVYGFDLFIAPEYRGDGTAVWFLGAVEAELNRLGYARMWGYVVAANRPARWLFAIAGHTPVRRYKGDVFLSHLVRHDGSLYLARAGEFKRLNVPFVGHRG